MAFQLIDRIAVEDEGEGPAVVCVHGLGGSSNTYTALMPAMARHRVVRVDLPGSGRSQRVEGELSIEGYADALLRVCDRLDVTRAHWVGHSMGTIVCQHIAASHPKRVASLALQLSRDVLKDSLQRHPEVGIRSAPGPSTDTLRADLDGRVQPVGEDRQAALLEGVAQQVCKRPGAAEVQDSLRRALGLLEKRGPCRDLAGGRAIADRAPALVDPELRPAETAGEPARQRRLA